MKIPFTLERGGRQYFLVKHSNQRKLPPAEMALQPWYIRFTDPTTKRPTWRKVGAWHEKELAIDAARTLLINARAGGNPFQKLSDQLRYRQTLSLARLLADYRAVGCPDTKGRPRTGDALAVIHANMDALLTFTWTNSAPAAITDADRDAYWIHRRATVARGTGDRTTELELVTLNNALQWAWRKGAIEQLPRGMKTSYRDPAKIEHARDVMPSSSEELHALARELFKVHETEVYGWAVLLGAFTGLRLGELQALRAAPERIGVHVEPGWYDDRCLIVPRTKRRAGKSIQDEFALNDATRAEVRPLLGRIRQWRALRSPVPPSGSLVTPSGLLPMPENTLTKQLQRVAKGLGLPQRQAHGLRAYYVSARLAAGILPSQVACEIGHLGSGDHLVRTVYGDTPPQWRGLENVYTWLPPADKSAPAWAILQPAGNVISL
jgi:integrase